MPIDAVFIKDTIAELRPAFAAWAANGRKIQAMLNPQPGGILSSDDLTRSLGGNPYSAVAVMSEYVSGRMAIIKNNFVGRAVTFPPKIEAEVQESDPADQEGQRKLFRFFHGVRNVLNDRQQTMWGGTSWDRMILEHIATFGKCITMPTAARGVDGNVEFRADLLDPLCCWHDFDSYPRRFGRDSLLGVKDARRFVEELLLRGRIEVVPQKVIDMLNDKDRDAVEVADVWVEYAEADQAPVWRGLAIEGEVVGPWGTDFLYLPVSGSTVHAAPGAYMDFATRSHGSGMSPRGVAANRVLRHAESVLAPLFYINEQFRQYMSLLMEGLANAMNPGYEAVIEDGSSEIAPSKDQLGPGSMFVHGRGIDIQRQDTATSQIGQAANIFRDIIDSEFRRLAPDVLFGQSNPGDSGYLQVNKLSHANAVFRESTSGASVFIKRTFDELVRQFNESNMTFVAKGWKHQGKAGPQFFPDADFKSSDMPKQYILNVEVLTDLPQNDAGKMDLFLSGVGKAFSMRQGRINILDDEDPNLTQELIDQEEYEAMPPVKAGRMMQRALDHAKSIRNQIGPTTSRVQRRELMDQAQIAEDVYQALRQQAMGLAENRLGQETAPRGMSPETLPPEMAVGMNPDQNAEAAGAISSFLGGRPQTAEVE